MKKKIIAGVAAVCAAACMAVTAFAETYERESDDVNLNVDRKKSFYVDQSIDNPYYPAIVEPTKVILKSNYQATDSKFSLTGTYAASYEKADIKPRYRYVEVKTNYKFGSEKVDRNCSDIDKVSVTASLDNKTNSNNLLGAEVWGESRVTFNNTDKYTGATYCEMKCTLNFV